VKGTQAGGWRVQGTGRSDSGYRSWTGTGQKRIGPKEQESRSQGRGGKGDIVGTGGDKIGKGLYGESEHTKNTEAGSLVDGVRGGGQTGGKKERQVWKIE